jgi:hypothetical protein
MRPMSPPDEIAEVMQAASLARAAFGNAARRPHTLIPGADSPQSAY